ncbi:MAG: FtsH protease activity modulator HflK [Dongiaceae bacterium]
MPWQDKGGGGGPWGGGQGPWGRGPGGGQRPPDIEDFLRRGQDRLRTLLPGGFGGGRGLALILIVVLLVWLMFGFYRVEPEEQGVAMIFGRWVATTQPGLRYNLPAPIGSVETPKVTRVNRVEVGFRSGLEQAQGGTARDVPQESLMLTGDENIIDIQFVVFWQIKDAGEYLFNIRDPDDTVKSVAESAMREIIGQTAFERARTQGRAEIEQRTVALMQKVLDSYGAGIFVSQVELQKVDPPESTIAAFRDVQAARADKERLGNEAQAYFNEVTQRAEGEAQKIIKDAEGYKTAKIATSKGDAKRFLSVYEQYLLGKEVTERRMFLETMERVLGGMNKVLLDAPAGAGGGVPYLSLDELLKRSRQQPAPAQSAGATDSMGAAQ